MLHLENNKNNTKSNTVKILKDDNYKRTNIGDY